MRTGKPVNFSYSSIVSERQLSDAASSAAGLYFEESAEIYWIGHSATATFRVVIPTARRSYLLRLHLPKLDSAEACWYEVQAIRSEIEWLDRLSRRGLPVQVPVRAKTGHAVSKVEVLGKAVPCSVLEWIEGKPIDDAVDVERAREIGQLCGRLHLQSSEWNPPAGFSRPSVDYGLARRSIDRLSVLEPTGILSAEGKQRLLLALDRIEAETPSLSDVADHWGLIHGDIHPGNCLLGPDGIHLIDFGRCGFGAFQHDVAEALQYLGYEARREFVDGYESVRPLCDGTRNCLEAYLLISALDGFSFHAGDPDERAYLARALPNFVSTCVDPFLDGRPFLFGPG